MFALETNRCSANLTVDHPQEPTRAVAKINFNNTRKLGVLIIRFPSIVLPGPTDVVLHPIAVVLMRMKTDSSYSRDREKPAVTPTLNNGGGRRGQS